MQGFSAELTGVLDGTKNPPAMASALVHGGKVRRYRATLNLANANVGKNIADTNVLVRIPRGETFISGIINSTVGLGAAATVAIGNATDAAKYRAAAIFNVADTPTLFGKAAAEEQAPSDGREDVLLTVGAAALPGAGILVVDILTSGR